MVGLKVGETVVGERVGTTVGASVGMSELKPLRLVGINVGVEVTVDTMQSNDLHACVHVHICASACPAQQR